MTDTVTGDASRPQPAPVDLSGIDPHHPDQESPERLLATTIAETASGVTGVHHLGGLAARTLDRARRQVLGTSSAPGVTVSSEGLVTVVDLDIVVEYPHAIDEVIENARTQVSHAARQIASGPVAVNVTVTDIHGPFDQDPAVLDAIDTAGDTAREVGGRVRDRARDAAAAARDLGEQARDQAADVADQTRERAADVADQARDRAADVAAAARDLSDQVRDGAADVAEQARDQAADVAGQVRDGASDVAEQARDRAADAADVARDRASDVAEQARDRASDVKDAARENLADARATSDAAAGSLDAARAHVDGALDEARRDVDKARLEVDEARLEVDRALDADARDDAKHAAEADRPTDETR